MGEINQLRARVELEVSKRGITMAAFARSVGRSSQSLYYILERNSSRLETLKAFADALDMTLDDFLAPVTMSEWFATIPRMR